MWKINFPHAVLCLRLKVCKLRKGMGIIIKKLFTAIRQGNLDEVTRILDKNPDLIICIDNMAAEGKYSAVVFLRKLYQNNTVKKHHS